MAQTKRKRQTKHRGNAAGVVESRGRTGRKPTAAEKIQLAEREPPDPEWVESVFDQVNMLVLEDNADALAARVVELAGARAATGVRAAP